MSRRRTVGGIFVAGCALSSPHVASAALEEVVVTARKVEESAQDVPIAVTSYSREMLAQQNVFDLTDLRGTPGLYLQRGGPFAMASSFGIRGLSVADKESTFDPAVGVVVDGVFIGRTLGAVLDLYDTDSLEVLRGPQGTLFGRNTIGGVLNIRSRRPGDELAVNLKASAGRFDTYEVAAGLDVPVGDTLRTRVAGKYARSDGYYTNTAPDGPDDVGGSRSYGGRAVLEWEASDATHAGFIVDLMRNRSPSSAEHNATRDPSIAALNLAMTQPFFDSAFTHVLADSPYTTAINLDPAFGLESRQDLDADTFILEFQHEFGSLTLDAVTGYVEMDSEIHNDFDRTSETHLEVIERNDFEQLSQEIRLHSDYGGRFEWIGGLYYYESDVLNTQVQYINQCLFVVPNIPGGAFCPIPGPFRVAPADGFYRQEARTYAVFGEAYFDLSDAWRLTLGGRWTEEKKEFVNEPANDDLVPGNPDPQATFADDRDWSDFSPRVSLDYRFTDDVLTYLSYTRGFRSGGYNGRAGSITSGGPYDEETVTAWELGLKSDYFEQRLRLNLAAYLNDYQDMQLTIFRAAPGGGQETIVENAGEATIGGLEVEATWLASDRLTLIGSLSLMDAEYDRFCAAIPRIAARPTCGPDGQTDNTDLAVPRTPESELFLGANYVMPVTGGGTLTLAADWTRRDELESQSSNFAIGTSAEVDLVAASLTYRASDSFSVTVFGKNLLDEEYVYLGTVAGNLFAFQAYAPPRTYGVTVHFDY